MKRLGGLLAAVALIVAGCSSSSSDPKRPDPSISFKPYSLPPGAVTSVPDSELPTPDVPSYSDDGGYTEDPEDTFEIPDVIYKVTGSGSRALVTYTSEAGEVEQHTAARLPWSKKVTGGGPFYTLSAQDSDGSGKISCQIVDTDGTVLSKHTSRGPYAVVSCTAR